MADVEKPQLTGETLHNGAVERLIDIKKMWAIVLKNWKVLRGDMVRLVPLFMFPMMMIVIFGYTSGNLPKEIPAGLVDYDHTAFSYGVHQQLSGTELYTIKYLVSTQDEGKRLMDEGKIKVLFVLPDGLGESVAAGKPAQISVMVDESDSSVAQIARSFAQSFALSLSQQATAARLAAISAQAQSASQELSSAKQALLPGQPTEQIMAAAAAYQSDSASIAKKSGDLISESTQALKNSLGYLVDQNELLEHFTPSQLGGATLQLLAVGDQQQSVLQQIGFYQILGASNARLGKDAGLIYSSARQIAGQADAQRGAAEFSVSLLDSAGAKLSTISNGAQAATNPITAEILEPYGYGRRGIDFLLPSILALVIFQGATMGLGRAIAGERKDGSLTRVFLTPTSNVTIILGTQLFYMILETVRSSMIIFVAIALFGVTITGNIVDIVAIVAILAMGATGVGMVLSVITNNQEQYMAVGMLISMPIMFLSGVFFPLQTMPPFLQSFAAILPVTYAADALRGIMVKGFQLYQVVPDIIALLAFGIFTLALSIWLFKREVI